MAHSKNFAMKRTIDIEENFESLNPWIQKSIKLFYETNYLDRIAEVYNYSMGDQDRIEQDIRRKIRRAHNNRNDSELIKYLKSWENSLMTNRFGIY